MQSADGLRQISSKSVKITSYLYLQTLISKTQSSTNRVRENPRRTFFLQAFLQGHSYIKCNMSMYSIENEKCGHRFFDEDDTSLFVRCKKQICRSVLICWMWIATQPICVICIAPPALAQHKASTALYFDKDLVVLGSLLSFFAQKGTTRQNHANKDHIQAANASDIRFTLDATIVINWNLVCSRSVAQKVSWLSIFMAVFLNVEKHFDKLSFWLSIDTHVGSMGTTVSLVLVATFTVVCMTLAQPPFGGGGRGGGGGPPPWMSAYNGSNSGSSSGSQGQWGPPPQMYGGYNSSNSGSQQQWGPPPQMYGGYNSSNSGSQQQWGPPPQMNGGYNSSNSGSQQQWGPPPQMNGGYNSGTSSGSSGSFGGYQPWMTGTPPPWNTYSSSSG